MNQRSETMQDKVLAVLQRRGTPMSAYEVLGQLRDVHPRLAPPTIYRALAALIERGGVHRLESLKAFVACSVDGHGPTPVLLICEKCRTVEEPVSAQIEDQLSDIAQQVDFTPTRHVIEVHGRCTRCKTSRLDT